MNSTPLLIYIHGFNSSPQSYKAQSFGQWLNEQQANGSLPAIDYQIPDLSNYPNESKQQLQQLIEAERGRPIGLIGSSLGGFFATYLGERYQLPAVLINPVVKAHELISHYLGENENYHTGERYTLTAEHMDALAGMHPSRLSYPHNYWLLLQTGDETLDYRRASAYYRPCRSLIESGGDHGFVGFERWRPAIVRFLLTRAGDGQAAQK